MSIEPTDCQYCKTPYDVCTYNVLTDLVACCPACSYSTTHDQNKWEEKYGVRYISDVREDRSVAAEEAVNAWLEQRTEETLLAAIVALQAIPVDKPE